jgi:hypothetical protein
VGISFVDCCFILLVSWFLDGTEFTDLDSHAVLSDKATKTWQLMPVDMSYKFSTLKDK